MGDGAAKKIHNIQMLRFFAASLVVLFHADQALASRYVNSSNLQSTYLFGFGAVGVHIFFVISGYIMVLTTSRTDHKYSARTFLSRRLVRIYPAYWIFAGLYLLWHTLLGPPYKISLFSGLASLALLPEHSSAIIGPAWTLSFEMFFYLCFGLAMTLGQLRGLIILSATFIFMITLGHFIHTQSQSLLLISNALLMEFLAGAWIAYASLHYKLQKYLGIVSVGISLILFGAGILFGYHRMASPIMWGIPSAALIFGAVVLEAEAAPPLVRALSTLGESSYSLYLSHILIITVMLTIIKSTGWLQFSLPLISLVIAIIGIIFAHIFYLNVESRVTRFLNARVNQLLYQQ